MKKFILLFLFFFSFNIGKTQSVLCNPVADERECLYAYVALKEFIDDSNVVVIFNGMEPLHEAFNGLTWQYNKNLYVVSIAPYEKNPFKRIWIIFHEIGHVIDLYHGELTQFPTTWKGKPVDENLPWDERPWEANADKWAYRIWRRVLEEDPPFIPNLNMVHPHENNCINH